VCRQGADQNGGLRRQGAQVRGDRCGGQRSGGDPGLVQLDGQRAYDDENTLIVHDRGLARDYHAEWQRMWEAPGEETL
jgi:hypothetical protein